MDKDEALQMCLEYIETDAHERKYVRHAIKAALAQPAQEPVAWVGLTDEERESIAQDYSLTGFGYQSPFKAIEDKLKEKNT
jgi:hypothetical protein